MSLSRAIVLFYALMQLLKLGVVDATKTIYLLTGKSEQAICGWRATFLINSGRFFQILK